MANERYPLESASAGCDKKRGVQDTRQSSKLRHREIEV
jgi:hypothetical protein